MRSWDYQNNKDSGQAALFSAFWAKLCAKLWGDQLGYTPSGSNIMWGTKLLLDQPNDVWWDDITTKDRVETRDDILRSAFVDAYKEIAAKLGSDYQKWQWGTLHTATFVSNPLGASGISVIENFVNGGPVAASGGPEIVNATSWRSGSPYAVTNIPSMRMIVDFNNFENSQWMDATGQSGHPTSPHYRDMIDKWRNIQYDIMPWDRDKIKASVQAMLILQPK
jgi:penicillin G amidase